MNNNITKNKELDFQFYLRNEKIKLTRYMCLLSSLLFASFAFVDMLALPSAVYASISVRLVVVVVLMATFASTFHKLFDKYYHYILSLSFIVAILGIEAMIYISDPKDQAYGTYFVGIILVLIALFSWTYLHRSVSVLLASVSIVIYFGIEYFDRDFVGSGRVPTILSNMFFIISTVFIGLLAQVARDGYLKQNFLLQQSLQAALKEKTIESNDYEYQANHDALTLLPNRRYMTKLLEESLQVAKEKDKILAILFFDLNGFKQLNDVYGHAVGDEVLIIVAKRLELAIRKGDCISRIGGDEYLVGLLIDRDNASDVNTMAAKFAAIISEPMNIDGNMFKVGASVGIAAYPLHGNNVEVLIDIADKKMYKIKQGLQKLAKQRKKKDGSEEAVVIFPGNSKSNSNTL